VHHRFILINFLLFSAAVQFCKGAIQIPHCDCYCHCYWTFYLQPFQRYGGGPKIPQL